MTLPRFTFLILSAFSAAAGARSFDGLGTKTIQALGRAQDACNNLDFGQGERRILAVIHSKPKHPLPRIFLQAAYLARIQECLEAHEDCGPLFERFDQATSDAMQASEKRAQQDDAYAHFYLGGSQGARGLAKLYRHDYVGAYNDGQAADKHLRQALEKNPGLADALLGRGQYEYYTGRLAGLLQLVLHMEGDVKKGIALLQDCATHGSFTAVTARLHLARILCTEEKDFDKALPYVREVYRRYPANYSVNQYALAEVEGLGLENPAAQELLAAVQKQWDSGWRPPGYAKMEDPGRLRTRLEKAKPGKETVTLDQSTPVKGSSRP
jgi:tetratricopeptide (TPR) repeat protein